MALDPNIALQVGQPVQPLDPLKAYGQVLTLKGLIDQQQLGGLQMAQAQRAADKEMRLADLARRSGGNFDAYVTGMREIDPEKAFEWDIKSRKAGFEQQEAERKAEKARLDTLERSNSLIGQALYALGPNPSYGAVMDEGLRLNQEGLKIDLNSIPQDPAKLAQYLQQVSTRTMTIDKQIAERRAAMEPKSEVGRILYDQQRLGGRGENGSFSQQVGDVSVSPDGNSIRTPLQDVRPGLDPYDAAIARAAYGPAPDGFQYVGRGPELRPIQNVLDQRLAERKAGATVLNIDNKQQEASAKQIGEDYGKRFGEMQRAEFSSRAMVTKLSRLNQVLQDVDTGKLTPLGTQIAGYARSLGFDIDPKLGNKEAALQLESMIALDFAEKMKGPLSDSDRRFVQSIASMTDKSTKARALQIETMKRLAERDAQIAKMARDYKKRHGKFDEGFDDEVSLWMNQNPLFPDLTSIDAELNKRGR